MLMCKATKIQNFKFAHSMKSGDWRVRLICRSAILLLVVVPKVVVASDLESGDKLSRRWCVSCHLVANDQVQASADVPSFRSIAERPGFDSAAIATFLLDPHPKMPSLTLSRKEADDIAEYIASLAGKQRKVDPPNLERRRL